MSELLLIPLYTYFDIYIIAVRCAQHIYTLCLFCSVTIVENVRTRHKTKEYIDFRYDESAKFHTNFHFVRDLD